MPLVRLASAVLIVSMLAPAAAMQTPSQSAVPGFRSGTDLVQVDVSVLDGHRVPVKGLTANDFIVLEDGKPRDVAAFAAIELPARVSRSDDAAWTREVPSDVTTNQTGAAGGRVVVILMDRTIPPGGFQSIIAKKIATAAVNDLGPGDIAALISTSGAVPQNLTSDRQRLLAAINQKHDWATGVSDEAKEIEAGVSQGVDLSTLADGRCLCGLCVLETITNVAKALEGLPRQRKSLLFVGSDIIFQDAQQLPTMGDVTIGNDCGRRQIDAREVMFSALDRSGVIVHSIDPSGLQLIGPTGVASSTLRAVGVGPSFTSAVGQSLKRQGNLEVLPSRTGGRVVANTNAPEEKVPDILHESDAYYLIGYRPADPQIPGQTRKIEVKVRRSGMKVSARREYLVPTDVPASPISPGDETRTALGTAMRSTLPDAGAALSMTAGSFGVAGKGTAGVAVALDVSSIVAQAVLPTGAHEPLTIAVAAYDMLGRPEGAVEVVSVTDLPSRPGRVEALARLDLAPGDHELRAAVVPEGAGRTASVFTHITVPPFADNPLTLSHIVIAASGDTATIQRQRVSDLIPIVPTTNREFSRTVPVNAFMRVYQGLRRTGPIEPVRVTASVTDHAGAILVRESLTLKPAEFGDRRIADCRLTLPISRLEPGEYLLTVEASEATRQAGRAIRFTVR